MKNAGLEAPTMKMLRTLAVLVAALLPSVAFAQSSEVAPFFYKYDLTATSQTYGAFAQITQGVGTVSSAVNTLTADLTAATPFQLVTVGSIIVMQTAPNTYTTRVVTAKASNVSLTIDGASLTLTAVPWRVQVFASGTGITNGWLPTIASEYAAVEFDMTTMAGTGGVNATIQCQLSGYALSSATVYTVNIPAAVTTIVPIAEKCNKVRAGINWVTSASGTDVLNVYLHTWSGR